MILSVVSTLSWWLISIGTARAYMSDFTAVMAGFVTNPDIVWYSLVPSNGVEIYSIVLGVVTSIVRVIGGGVGDEG